MVFESSCIIHLMTTNKALGARGKPAIIIDKNDEMKRYRVFFLPMERVMVVSQYVKNIETLYDIKGKDLLKYYHGADGEEWCDDKDVAC